MAWMEMRILIAKMVFLLDYELVDDKLDWERTVLHIVFAEAGVVGESYT